MDDKVDLVSYICNGSSHTTLHDVLFDGSEFDSSHTVLPSLEKLPDDWMVDDRSTNDLFQNENFNFGNIETNICY